MRICLHVILYFFVLCFSNFPKAIVAFGNCFSRSDYEKFQENIAKFKAIFDGANEAAEKTAQFSKRIQTIAQIAGKFAPILSVLVALVGEVDQLYKELKNVEAKIFNTIFEGKVKALEHNLKNVENRGTNEVQMVAELVNAISHLNEILPVFAKKGSIFRERFYQGAPLFVRLCVILKGVSLIAEKVPDYSNSNLHILKQEYQEVLDWYRRKCIGVRMASCYIKKTLTIDGISNWTNDWDRHYKNYKKYYDESTWFPWLKYGENLGGDGWRLWFGFMTYCKLIDPWDTRVHEEVEFESIDIKNTSDVELSNGDIQYHRDVLAEYRRRVEAVMLFFLNSLKTHHPSIQPKIIENSLTLKSYRWLK